MTGLKFKLKILFTLIKFKIKMFFDNREMQGKAFIDQYFYKPDKNKKK